MHAFIEVANGMSEDVVSWIQKGWTPKFQNLMKNPFSFEAPKSQFFLQKSRKFAKTGQTPITQVGQTELINGAVQTVKLYEAVLLVVATNKANVKMSVMNETIKAVESIVEHGGESYTYKLSTLKKNFLRENFRVQGEMRDEILVYDLFLTKFWAKMASKCKENAAKIWILGFRV